MFYFTCKHQLRQRTCIDSDDVTDHVEEVHQIERLAVLCDVAAYDDEAAEHDDCEEIHDEEEEKDHVEEEEDGTWDRV